MSFKSSVAASPVLSPYRLICWPLLCQSVISFSCTSCRFFSPTIGTPALRCHWGQDVWLLLDQQCLFISVRQNHWKDFQEHQSVFTLLTSLHTTCTESRSVACFCLCQAYNSYTAKTMSWIMIHLLVQHIFFCTCSFLYMSEAFHSYLACLNWTGEYLEVSTCLQDCEDKARCLSLCNSWLRAENNNRNVTNAEASCVKTLKKPAAVTWRRCCSGQITGLSVKLLDTVSLAFWQPPGLKNKANTEVPKTSCPGVLAGSKRVSISKKAHVNMANLTALKSFFYSSVQRVVLASVDGLTPS